MTGEQRTPRRASLMLSWVFFAAALAVLAIMGVLYYRDQQAEDRQPPIPTFSPGGNELIHVVEALRDAGLEVEILPRTARNARLTEVGQPLAVDGATLVVFIYPDVASREAESDDLDPTRFTVATASGTPVAEGEPHLVAASNVIGALFGASEEVTGTVDAAIQGLP